MVIILVFLILFYLSFWNSLYKMIREKEQKESLLPNIVLIAFSYTGFLITLILLITRLLNL